MSGGTTVKSGIATERFSGSNNYTKRIYSTELSFRDRKTGKMVSINSTRMVHQLNNIDINMIIPAGTKMANGRRVLFSTTNKQLMARGRAPFVMRDSGVLAQVELHHLTGVETQYASEFFNGKKMDGTLIEIPSDLHDKYSRQIHIKGHKSFRVDTLTGKLSFDAYKYHKIRAMYWKDRLNELL